MYKQRFVTGSAQEWLERPGVLSVIEFGEYCRPSASLGLIPTGLKSLSGHNLEIITFGGESVERSVINNCHWNRAGDLVCVAAWLSPDECSKNMAEAAHNAYRRLYGSLLERGFKDVIKVWNFLPEINSGLDDGENYKQFCVGRHAAFAELQVAESDFPSAVALGHRVSGAVIYALARRGDVKHFENPNQQSAYQYPRRYGPVSPSFARGTLTQFAGANYLFISGTASIKGHETLAVGNPERQLDIAIENLLVLVAHADSNLSQLQAVRVYLREESDLDVLQVVAQKHLAGVLVNYVLADVCRANLSVELEALACAQHSGA